MPETSDVVSKHSSTELGGITAFVCATKGLVSLSFKDPTETLSLRAFNFNQAMQMTDVKLHPTLADISVGPSWLCAPLERQTQLINIAGALANAHSLCILFDGQLLRDLADRIGEVILDQIIVEAKIKEVLPKKVETKFELNQLEQDGQSILLASLPSSLLPILMSGPHFSRANKASVSYWRPQAANLLARSEALWV
jgi:hypothetical protein